MPLFHYTKLSTLLEHILPYQKLKSNDLNCMNDPRESHPWSFGGINIPLETLFPDYKNETHIDCQMRFGKMIKDRLQVICFSGAKKEGWNNEMMWAHYAEKQRGVCLEFDTEELTTVVENHFPSSDWVLEDVNYIQNPVDSPWIYWNTSISIEYNFNQNIKRIYRDLILHKSHFWEKEDEKRLIFLDHSNAVYLPIKPCLKAIYLGIGFPRIYLPAIENLIVGWDVKIYQNIYQHDQYLAWRLKKSDGKWLSYAEED
jgi:hypothetical protein